MEFAIIFLVFAVCIWFAWCRQARKAIVAYSGGPILTVALYLHHATESLPLSFSRAAETSMSPRFAVTLNALALYAIGLVLLGASYFQITLGELPCPLCMLQRVAFVALVAASPVAPALGPFEKGAIRLMLAMTVLNAASALLECGRVPGRPRPLRADCRLGLSAR